MLSVGNESVMPLHLVAINGVLHVGTWIYGLKVDAWGAIYGKMLTNEWFDESCSSWSNGEKLSDDVARWELREIELNDT